LTVIVGFFSVFPIINSFKFVVRGCITGLVTKEDLI
jgi:hypothetical protein